MFLGDVTSVDELAESIGAVLGDDSTHGAMAWREVCVSRDGTLLKAVGTGNIYAHP